MNQEIAENWEKCLSFMRENLNAIVEGADLKRLENSFELLFAKVQPVYWKENIFVLMVPSLFYREYIEDNYISLLAVALKKYFGKNIKLRYQIGENNTQTNTNTHSNLKATTTVLPNAPQITNTNPKPTKITNPFAIPGTSINIESNLKADFSFENYVEGECNKFATNVAKSIAQRPGTTVFNPLFLHGGYGVGKTHLGQAIGIEVKNQFPEKTVLYLSSEKFVQQFVAAARAKKITEFVEFFQKIDLLIIDDIQFLAKKPSTQESFFHIFDFLHQNGKQIILTSDRAPVDITDIQERIISRFKWGLTAEIKSPDFDTRRKIIIDKLRRDGIELPDNMLDFLANEVHSSVRDLIGVINSVIAYSTVYKSDLTLDLLKETISKIANSKKKTIDITRIQETICEYFNLERNTLLSKSRKREVALPRQIAMYFAKELTDTTFSKIGEEMGGRDHSTVMHAYKTIKDTLDIDKELKKFIKELSEKLKS